MWSFLVIVFGIFVLIRVDKAFRKISEIEKRLNMGQIKTLTHQNQSEPQQPQAQAQPKPQPQSQPQTMATQPEVTAPIEIKEEPAQAPANNKEKKEGADMDKFLGIEIEEELAQQPVIKEEEKKEGIGMEHFLGAKFFAVLGVASIVLAIGFFTLWAFANNLIGPTGRIVVGIIFSSMFLITGELMKAKYPKFFQAFSAVGIAGLLTTTFVARMHYELISSFQSTLAYFLEVGLGLILSMRYNSRIIGNFAIVGGLMAPFFINPENPNAVSLLLFLAILSVAGFIISNKKKWPEILVVLFFGVLIFESLILSDGSLKDSPLIFIGFIFLLHTLIGSGGVIKLTLEAIKSKGKEVSVSTIGQLRIVLFISSILFANLFVGIIFENQGWEHIGLLILFQAVVLYGLSLLFKKLGMAIAKNSTLIIALFFTVLATILEVMEYSEEFMLSLVLLVEGILFYAISKKVNNSVFKNIGRLTILIGIAVGISSVVTFSEITIFTLFSILALLYSINMRENSSPLDKLWSGLAIIIASIQVFFWSFYSLDNFIKSDSYKFLVMLAPVLGGLGVAFSVIKIKRVFLNSVGVVAVIFSNFYFVTSAYGGLGTDVSIFIALAIILIGNFLTIYSLFFVEKYKNEGDNNINAITIFLLGFSSLAVLVTGFEIFSDIERTFFWIIWGGTLLVFGFMKHWNQFRYFGLGAFIFLIAKLYLVDVWEWEIWVRFIAFMAVGIALLVIAFFYQKKER